MAFARNAGAGLVIVGAAAGVGAATATTTVGGSIFAGGALGGGAGVAAIGTAIVATGVVVPVYFLVVASFNSDNKAAIVAEFNRRRLALPLTLAPGSLFFPMVANPRSLGLRWSSGTTGDGLLLPLDSLHGLHVTAAAPASAGK